MPVKAKGANIKYQEVEKLFTQIPTIQLHTTERFLNGDHWQDETGWIGWRPITTSPEAMAQWQFVVKAFTAKNVIRGMVKRLQGAILGKEPDWNIVSNEVVPDDDVPLAPGATPRKKTDNEKLFEQYDKDLTEWWTEKNIHGVLKEWIFNNGGYGKTGLRIYIPKGYLTENSDGSVSFKPQSFKEAIDKIFVEVIHYTQFTDAKDLNYGSKFNIVKLDKENDNDPDVYELTFVDENKKTNIRQITAPTGEANNNGTDTTVTKDLGGNNLTFVDGKYEDAIISPTIKQQQRRVNQAKTHGALAIENINFPETTFINASLPTEKVKGENGQMIEVEKPMAQGFGFWRNLLGVKYQDAQGGDRITDPDVKYRDSKDPKLFNDDADTSTRDMHQEAGMLYIYMADSEYASGESKIESMTDYIILLLDKKTLTDNVGVWLLTTVTRLAFNFLGKTELNNKFNVLFDSSMTIGRVSTEDKRLMLDEVAARVRSMRSYIIKAEVNNDPNLELRAIKAEEPLHPVEEPNDTTKAKQ